MIHLSVEIRRYPLREPFVIARGAQTETQTLLVTLVDQAGRRGRGEGCGVEYAGETLETMSAQIEAAREVIEAGVSRQALLELLPAGGARCAIDAALWDLQAKQSGRSAFELAGATPVRPVTTAYTIGIRHAADYEIAARLRANYKLLKIKVDAREPLAAVESARRGAPDARFIVDPNQAWSVDMLKALASPMADLGVVLIEQPIRVGDEPGLDGYRCPIQLCADELVNDSRDLEKAKGRFDVINIKLDKSGGLTSALALAGEARAEGFDLMVGCMVGSSLGMAPAMVLAQQCAFADLDGPLLQATDWPDGLSYREGVIDPPSRAFWG